MRRGIVVGCGALLAVAVGCGSVNSNSSGTGGAGTGGAGGTGTAGTGTAGTGTAGAGAAGTGTAGTGTAGSGTGGTGSGGTGNVGAQVMVYSADAVAFAAGQDGDGAWHPLAPLPTANGWTLGVTGQRYGLAYGCANAAGDNISITVIQATVAETARVTVACGGLATANPLNVAGTVTGLTGTQTAQIDIASRSGTATVAMPTYSIMMVPSGTWDLFARRMTTAPVFDRMIRNAVTVAGAVSFNFDFTNQGFAPEMHAVTFQGATASEMTSTLVVFRNAGGSPFAMGPFTNGSYPSLPAAQRKAGDIHGVTAGATDSAASTRRNVRRSFIAAMDFTAAFPPMPVAPTISVAGTTPYVRPRATIPAGSAGVTTDIDRYDIAYTQRETAPARTRSWSLQLTRGWIASAAATDYTVPDLSGLSAFQAWWGLTAALETQWQQFANWTTAGVAELLRVDQTPAELDGRESRSTQRDGKITF
jgi:hypothetical protein